jgi:hypothetical protein
MSETATAVVEQPKAAAKLVRPREDALAYMQAQLEKGANIKAMRIRSGAELDAARAAKLEWTGRTTDILLELFDQPAVAEECNDWVGRIYPEYAEFGNFVEQFYAEMDHRLKRLKAVAKWIEKQPTANAANAAKAPAASVPQRPQDEEEIVAASTVIPATTRPKLEMLAGLLVVCKADEPTRQSVADFLESLDVIVSVVDGTAAIGESLDRVGAVNFAVVLSGESQNDYGFELGFCAGRLGLKRVILLHTQPAAAAADSRGFTHVALDNGGGWMLQLARHLKRAGLGVDLNRLA